MSTLLPSSMRLNLSVLDGVRCLTCIAIIAFHVHFFFGYLFFPATAECMMYLRSVPILSPIFLNVTFHMTMFWTISGFLCEYQLSRLRERYNGKLQPSHCVLFLLNRFLRLYPLYSVVVILIYFAPTLEHPELIEVDGCSSTQTFLSLLFIPVGDDMSTFLSCVGHLWSVVMDVHGYLAIVLLSLILSDDFRRYGLVAVYCLSLVYMAYINEYGPSHIGREDLDHLFSFGFFSLEYASLDELRFVFEGGHDPRIFYPDIDFNSDQIVAAREARLYHYSQTHYTSIFKHASAMLLGSFLFLNLKNFQQRKKNRNTYLSVVKVFAIPLILHATAYRFHYTGMVAYLLLDVLLTIDPESSGIEKMCLSLFSNRFWSLMAPYTYGIYVVHMFIVAGGFLPPVLEERARQIVEESDLNGPCRDYNFSFILTKTVQVLLASWMVSFVLNLTIERPFRKLRNRLLRKSEKEKNE